MPLVLLLTAFVGCVAPEPEPEPEPEPSCPDSVPGAVHLFADGFAGTEGITFSDDGRLFAGDGTVLVELQPDGAWDVIADVPGIIGLAYWDGRVIAATSDSGDADGRDGVFSIDPDTGEVTRIGPGLEGANFVTVTPWDTLIVSDPNVDKLFELTADGTVTTWLDGLESPNGTAFSADGDTLWAVSTYANPAPVWRIPVTDGTAGTAVAITEYEPAIVPDGVAVGAGGDLYVALILGGFLDVVSADGSRETVAADIGAPASVAFGEGDAWDLCSIYSTSLFSDELFRVEVGEVGLPPVR